MQVQMPNDPAKVNLTEYVVVFADSAPPKECCFSAIDDDQAAGLMQKEYASIPWTLYHVVDGQRVAVYSYPQKCPPQPEWRQAAGLPAVSG